jgi:iron complex outermembrane receptor protein
MFKVPCVLMVFIFMLSGALSAQITGRLIGEDKQPVPFGNVLLVKAIDSSMVRGGVADEKGQFYIEMKDTGSFRLLAIYTGFEKTYTNLFSNKNSAGEYKVGEIVMKKATHELSNVDVVYHKPLIEIKPGKVIANIENSIMSAGGNALEILQKLPGVNVNNGTVLVNGKSGVQIMVDDKIAYVSNVDVSSFLRSIDATQIEKIEIISNPSSKYDASITAIINIVMKKDRNLGLTIQLNGNYRQGVYAGGYGGASINYRTSKFNYFGSVGYMRNNGMVINDINQQLGNSGSPSESFVQHLDNRGYIENMNGKLGIDYKPSQKQTLGFVCSILKESKTQNINDYASFTNSVSDSSLHTLSTNVSSQLVENISLNYKLDVDTTGRNLSADVAYVSSSNVNNQTSQTDYQNLSLVPSYRTISLISNLPNTVNIMAGQVDFADPLKKGKRFDFGLKASVVNTDNNAQYWNVFQGVQTKDMNNSNHFLYSENVYAGYIGYNQKFTHHLDLQLGLRGEGTNATSTQLTTSQVSNQDYFSLFPSGLLGWKINENNSFSLTYSRKIQRPDYNDLNPFLQVVNPYFYAQGNASLKPMYLNVVELTHNYMDGLLSTLGYTHIKDVVSESYRLDPITNITYVFPANLSYYNKYYLTELLSYPVNEWLEVELSLGAYYNEYVGVLQNVAFKNSSLSSENRMQTSIMLPKGWGIEFGMSYKTKDIDGAQEYGSVYIVGAGIRKKFGRDRGLVTLNCADIFWSDRSHYSENFESIHMQNNSYTDSRRLRLTLSWKIGQSNFKRAESKSSTDEDIERLKRR